MVQYNKGLCNKGDVYMYEGLDGHYHSILCDVDYLEIAKLEEYIKSRKSRDSRYFAAIKKLNKLVTRALQWEVLWLTYK